MNKFLAITIILLLTFNISFCFAANEEIGSAEAVIQRLANSKTDKTRSALIWGGIGLGYSILSLLTPVKGGEPLTGLENFLKISYGALGALSIVYSGSVYFSSSGVESDYEHLRIEKIDAFGNPEKRNAEAEKSLNDRSREASNERMTRGLFLLSSSPLYLMGTSSINYTIVGIFFGVLGIYDLLAKSELEKEAERYFDDKVKR